MNHKIARKLLGTFFCLSLVFATTHTLAKDDAAKTSTDPGIAAPTLKGLSGLFRTVSGDIGDQHTFRVALHLQMLRSSSFLIQDDTHSRFISNLALSYTPWKYLEFFLHTQSMSNHNERVREANDKDKELILALGDLDLGGKFVYPATSWIHVGLNTALTLYNSVGGINIDGDSTSFYIGFLSTFDFQKQFKIPFRAHFNAGYQLDNSNSLVNFPLSYSLNSVQVEKFALGINPSRLVFRLGLESPLARWTKIGVTPILEFNMTVATDSEDEDFARFATTTPAYLNQSDLDGRISAWATVGVRVRPVKGLNIDLASDIIMNNPGFGYGPPITPYNIILGVSYAYDPKPQTEIITKEKVRVVEKRLGKAVGKVRVRIFNKKTKAPIEGAILTFPGKDLTGLSSDPDGTALTYGFEAGKLVMMVRHPDYKSAKAETTISVDKTSSLDLALEPKKKALGKLMGNISNRKGAPIDATIALSGTENKEIKASSLGTFAEKLKPGNYTATVSKKGYFSKVERFTLEAGKTKSIDISLGKKPKRSLIRITKRAIVIRRKVHFATNRARIKPNSRQILDSVADALLANKQIGTIEIQGHTDNRGSKQRNLTLSQERAEAVRDYLIKSGVSAERLIAKGYGSARPKRPNITARNRALNRRVEFRIRK